MLKCRLNSISNVYWNLYSKIVFLNLVFPVEKTFSSSHPSDGPIISGTMTVVSNTLYNVHVEIMTSDMSSSSEYAAIYFDGKSFGSCDGGNKADNTCDWYNCPISLNQIQTISSTLQVEFRYSQEVNTGTSTCTDNETGQSGSAVARVTLTSPGLKNRSHFSETILNLVLNNVQNSITSIDSISYIKQGLKHCTNHKYGSYQSLIEAEDECTNDGNCQGVYDPSCDAAGEFYLCYVGYSYETSSSSCVYDKFMGITIC